MAEVVPLQPRDLSHIRQVYDSYWRRIVSCNPTKAVPLAPGGLTVRLEDHGLIRVENPSETAAFVFRGLTARREDRQREDYDAYVQIRQLIRAVREDGAVRHEVSRSSLRIQCIESRTGEQSRNNDGADDPCRGYHGLHFDFQNPPDAFHPVVHLQVSPGCIPETAVGRPYHCPNYRADVPRIPTPPIDLPTIVYIITNDHLLHAGLDQRVVQETLQRILNAASQLPRFARGVFPIEGLPGGEMPYTWWYSAQRSFR